ncbi:MAG: trypsin-like peptidase domain-containing protein [Dehalococcoidia bacterium]
MRIPAITAFLLAAILLFSACRIEFSTTPISAPAPAMAPVIQQITPLDPGWKSPGPAENAAVLPNIADVVEKGYPGVVTITTEQIVNDMFSRVVLQSGAGSGWILDSSGIIVTNNHVVEGARKVVIQFSDGRTSEVTADRVFRDPLTDLAIIKVDLTDLPTVAIGDSGKLRVGDWVVAIGNPLGKGIKAKEGIISGLKVSLSLDEDESLYDLIETSAAINEGNSGGPLLNMKGQVIGITSAKIAKIGVEGMGYAISINSSLPILQELVNKGYITRPFLGVELYTVNDYVAYYNGLAVKRGAIITTVQPGSPAARAGMRRLDVIIRYQGKEITTAPELLRELRSSKIGDEISVTYVRGKNTYTATALLTDSPPPQ